jgi:lipoate-protein ligase A
MKWLDLTLPSPEENLACDEALLDASETQDIPSEVIRFWESSRPYVVVGYANRVQSEVKVEACAERGVPILRRCSGGGTVVQGPGCLNYSLVLRIDDSGATGSIAGTNQLVMHRIRQAIQNVLDSQNNLPPDQTGTVEVLGHTDLTLNRVKFSGNAQRRRRRALLFHGTLLVSFDLGLIDALLRMPSQQPEYREGREHAAFVRNLPITAEQARDALKRMWGTTGECEPPGSAAIAELVTERYSRPEWNFKF